MKQNESMQKMNNKIKWLTWVWMVCAWSCGGELEVKQEMPLWILETHPASGTTVDIDTLRQIRITFSNSLGENPESDKNIHAFFGIDISNDKKEWRKIGISSYDYEELYNIYIINLDSSTNDELKEGVEVRLTIIAGLTSEDGAVLPRDRVLFFRIGR